MIWKARIGSIVLDNQNNQNGSAVLYHYGVKGMKWGVRKEYEPHPRKRNNQTKNGAAKFKYRTAAKDTTGDILRTTAALSSATIIGLPIGIGLAMAANYREKKFIRNATDTTNIPEQPKRSLSSLPMKKRKMPPEEDCKNINDMWKQGGMNNCSNCILAFDMRRRGYDVSAAPTNEPSVTYDLVKKMYKGNPDTLELGYSMKDLGFQNNTVSIAEYSKRSYEKMIKDAESHFPPGARGYIQTRKLGSDIGHVFSWERDEKGINFYDAQIGSSGKDLMYNFSNVHSAFNLIRLDNLTPTDDVTTRLTNGRKK